MSTIAKQRIGFGSKTPKISNTLSTIEERIYITYVVISLRQHVSVLLRKIFLTFVPYQLSNIFYNRI